MCIYLGRHCNESMHSHRSSFHFPCLCYTRKPYVYIPLNSTGNSIEFTSLRTAHPSVRNVLIVKRIRNRDEDKSSTNTNCTRSKLFTNKRNATWHGTQNDGHWNNEHDSAYLYVHTYGVNVLVGSVLFCSVGNRE